MSSKRDIERLKSPFLGSLSENRRPSQFLDVTPVNELDLHDLLHRGVPSEGSLAKTVELVEFLNACGFDQRSDDPRMAPVWGDIKSFIDGSITCQELTALKRRHHLVQKAFSGDLAIPDFPAFTKTVARIFNEAKANDAGSVASYIPQLASVNPDLFGVAVCTVDGQRFSIGNARELFSVQSVSKVVTYGIAVETIGVEATHRHVGMEPSGRNFNERVLLASGIPHNPLINTGAIMAATLLYQGQPQWKRYEQVAQFWQRLCGTSLPPSVLQSTFLAERETANRNFCLAHMMAESSPFPRDLKSIQTVLDEYFAYCSLGVCAESMASAAATLANGGLNPISDKRVFSPETVTAVLSTMMTCGMYDASGEFSSINGFPAKSGVSGIILAVIPGVCGICTFSPRIDALGNSVRGLDFFSRLSREAVTTPLYSRLGSKMSTSFGNQFEWKTSGNEQVLTKFTIREFSSLWWAAASGDELRIRQLAARGIDVNQSNYSNRTALNFAITESVPLSTISLLIELGSDLGSDFLGSYIEDAEREGRADIVRLLRQAKQEREVSSCESGLTEENFDSKVPIYRFFAGQSGLTVADAVADCGISPDARTGLHVRALCGKLIIPNWSKFVDDLKVCIPRGVCLGLTTVDKQRFSSEGSDEMTFPIDAIVRVVLYELALSEVGADLIHKYVAKEPSGQPEGSLRLTSEAIPYNPLTRSGCLIVCHLLIQRLSVTEIMARIAKRLKLDNWCLETVSIVSDRQYSDLTKCLLFMLASLDGTGSLETTANLTLQLFTDSHSIRVNCAQIADYAKSLASLNEEHSSSILALLYSCGLDEISGEFAFRSGLPARTSLGGCVMIIVPGVLGYALRAENVMSTLPDEIREFQTRFGAKFNFHLFKRHFFSLNANDPTLFFGSNKWLMITQFLSAAFLGDLSTMKHLVAEGLDVNCQDMDGRTALHISNGVNNTLISDWLVEVGADETLSDRWGMTPLFESLIVPDSVPNF